MRSLPILLSIAALAVSFVPARPAVADGLAAAEEASLAPPKMEAVGAPVAPGGPDPAALSQPPSPLPQVAPLVLQSPEKANAYFQGTWMEGRHGAFSAAYTNLNGSPNSLLPSPETSWTTSATGFFGLRLWQGGEVYVAPEVIAETPFSGLHGLGGAIQNGELQKNGSTTPDLYLPRAFIRQTWDLEGDTTWVDSAPLQLAGAQSSRRIVFTAGGMSALDIFDHNAYAADPRQQFLNMGFMTHAAYDFAADARGYTKGLALEYYDGDWAYRFGHFLGPKDPNQEALNYQFFKYFGEQFELEHRHSLQGKPGKVRLLAYRNEERMGRFSDALAAYQADPAIYNAANCPKFNYGSENTSAPDLCWVRGRHVKTGAGINVEQALSEDLGIFFRGLVSDGRSEVYSYTSADRSVSTGLSLKGAAWGRPRDSVGLGYELSEISGSHIAYLSAGGIDGFIGDGALSYRPEAVSELYYNVAVNRFFFLTADVQHINNPGYNAVRGPVNVVQMRLHVEF